MTSGTDHPEPTSPAHSPDTTIPTYALNPDDPNEYGLVSHDFTADSSYNQTKIATVTFIVKDILQLNDSTYTGDGTITNTTHPTKIDHHFKVSRVLVCTYSNRWAQWLGRNSSLRLFRTDPESLRIILAVLHGKDDDIPNTVSQEQLAIVARTVEAHGVSSASLRGYLETLATPFRDDDILLQPGNEGLIWVAHVLGWEDEFHAMAKHVQMITFIDNEGWAVLPGGTRLSALPQGRLDPILHTRSSCIEELLDIIYARLRSYTCFLSKPIGSRDQECTELQAAALKAVVFNAPFHLDRVDEPGAEAVGVRASLKDVFAALRSIRVSCLPALVEGGVVVDAAHTECRRRDDGFMREVEDAIGRLGSPVAVTRDKHVAERGVAAEE